MILESRLVKLRMKIERDYSILPPFLKDAVDKRCPVREEFSSREDELEYLERRASCLSSLWMGMYAGALLVCVAVVSLIVESVMTIVSLLK